MLRNRTIAFALLGCLALCGTASAAQDPSGFSGLMSGGFIYARTRATGATADSDQYVGSGSLLYVFDNPGLSVQIDGDYDNYYGTKHEPADIWSAGGSVFWRDGKGTFGFSGSYFAVDAPAAPLFTGKKSVESYGLFGEYYVLDSLTLQARGGGTEGGGVGLQSYYGAGGFTWYDDPDFAFHAEGDYTTYSSGHNWTGVDASIEYMPFHSLPASFYVGYDYANISKAHDTKGGDSAAVYLGVKFHFGAGRSLRDYQRTGPLEWMGDSRPGANLKF
ncbi:MAG TPA: hypothetical protein VHZ29_05790 [Rhizomicrobium sp.]|jgi:hypothetical protein|nr:hypothetical protein [Rhizomicrobium sp.]